jgi:outer membrane protein OmpA-like peptidoglycan-associated protein
MYFTRNNFVKGSFKKDQKGVIRLKIYKATLKDGKWKDVVELPFNSSDYSVAHPALSPDEQTLYFASDMDGSYGKSDLFSVQIHEDGTYGKPQNLGSNINTEGTESFPFVSTKGHLYFTSNGHPGLGGYDIFVVELNDKDFGAVKNVGTPINGTQDDFTFVIDEGAQKGYFASNRKGGKGDDDIYAFQETQPLSFDCTGSISGIVMDSETQKVLSNTKVYITNTTTGEIKEVVSDNQGAYAFEVNCKELDYRLMANKSFYDGYKESLQLTRNEIKDYHKDIALQKQDLTKVLNLKPIYFDFDKATILVQSEKELQKVIDYMNQFPEINVDIRSHTDSRGTARYNLKLSGERAEATMAYLVAKGIAKDRLTAKGYGETELLNNCKDHHKCTEEAHQINRRSEFIVTEK